MAFRQDEITAPSWSESGRLRGNLGSGAARRRTSRSAPRAGSRPTVIPTSRRVSGKGWRKPSRSSSSSCRRLCAASSPARTADRPGARSASRRDRGDGGVRHGLAAAGRATAAKLTIARGAAAWMSPPQLSRISQPGRVRVQSRSLRTLHSARFNSRRDNTT
jgi:hypothetical protein